MKTLFVLWVLVLVSTACKTKAERSTGSDKNQFDLTELHLFTDTLPWKNKLKAMMIIDQKDTVSLKFRLRGGVSAQFAKHNYLLEFNQKQRFSSGIFDDDIILNANYIDKTFLRHLLCYSLFNEMDSVNIAPKTQFIWLKQNHEEKGLYVLMEKVNAGMLDLNKEDTAACLFKGTRFLTKEISTVFQDPENKYHQKYPDLRERNKGYKIEQLRNFILNSSDADFQRNFEHYFNLNNVIDWYILLAFTNNHDGELKNFYLYKRDADSPFLFSIWDCDDSFGRTGANDLNMHKEEVNMQKSILFTRLINHPTFGFEKRVNMRYQQHKQHLLDTTRLIRKIDQYYTDLKPYLTRNAQVWPLNDKQYKDSATTLEEYTLMKAFIRKRSQDIENRKSLIPLNEKG